MPQSPHSNTASRARRAAGPLRSKIDSKEILAHDWRAQKRGRRVLRQKCAGSGQSIRVDHSARFVNPRIDGMSFGVDEDSDLHRVGFVNVDTWRLKEVRHFRVREGFTAGKWRQRAIQNGGKPWPGRCLGGRSLAQSLPRTEVERFGSTNFFRTTIKPIRIYIGVTQCSRLRQRHKNRRRRMGRWFAIQSEVRERHVVRIGFGNQLYVSVDLRSGGGREGEDDAIRDVARRRT